MKITITNPTSSHCSIGHKNHVGLDVKPVSKAAGPQVFDVPEELVGYYTRALKIVLPGATVLVGDEHPEVQTEPDQDAALAAAEAAVQAEAAAKADAEAKAKAAAERKAKADAKKQAKVGEPTSQQQE